MVGCTEAMDSRVEINIGISVHEAQVILLETSGSDAENSASSQ